MKLTTKFRYGTRAMIDLTLHAEDGAVSLRDIAERQNISHKYLENLISALQAAGLVKSVRGPRGGYRLALNPQEITLRRLYDVLEGSGPLVECTDDQYFCERQEICVTREIWDQLYRVNMDFLDSITLKNMVERTKEIRAGADSYVI